MGTRIQVEPVSHPAGFSQLLNKTDMPYEDIPKVDLKVGFSPNSTNVARAPTVGMRALNTLAREIAKGSKVNLDTNPAAQRISPAMHTK